MRIKIGTFISVSLIIGVLVLHNVIPGAHAASMGSVSGPPGDPTTWTQTFSDDFTSPTLNTNAWATCYWWSVGANGCAGPNGELERYLPQNIGLHDGLLDLQALPQHYALNGKTYNYTSGMVTTAGKYSFLYGYMEARVKVPAGQGYWPAFWALAADHTPPTELDAMELLGNDPHTIYMGAHYADSQGTHHHNGTSWTGPDFSAAFHTIGVDWAADHLTFYVDGVAQYTITNVAAIPQRALYLILNLAVGGSWPGSPSAATSFPGHYLVDWVRVWQHTGSVPPPTTTPAPISTPAPPVPPTATAPPTVPPTAIPPATPTPIASGPPTLTGPIIAAQSGFNSTGASDDQALTGGNLDGYGASYSAQALAAAGFTPGATITSDDLHFTWPSVAPAAPDNYLAQGQRFALLNAQGVQTLGFLGASTGQAARGDGVITYTDGTTQPFSLTLDDWTLNGGVTHLTPGNRIVATMPYHNTANGSKTERTFIYAARVSLLAGKTVRSVTFPAATTHGRLHIFAIGTDAGVAATMNVGAYWNTFAALFQIS